MSIRRFITFSLKRGMWLSVSVPLIIALIASSFLLASQWQLYSGSRQMVAMKEFIGAMGALIHEQQKERGATSVFMNSGGLDFVEELAAQRKLTNAAAQQFLTIWEQSNIDRASVIGKRLSSVAEGLGDRETLRSSVDALSIKAPKALGEYTAHNAQMLNTISVIGAKTINPTIASKVVALEALLSAKEFSGIERAIGSGGFAAGKFDFQRIRFLERLITKQNAGLDRFGILAEDVYVTEVEAIANLEQTQDIMRMRAIAFDSFKTGDLQGVVARDFFSATTARINAFKALEDRLTNDIQARAHTTAQQSLIAILILLCGAGVALASSIATTTYVIRNMLTSVREISNAGDRLARGEDDAKLPTDSPRELGRIVWSINFFRESVVKAKQREAEIVKEREETERAAREEQENTQRLERERAEREATQAREEQERMNCYVEEMSEMVRSCSKGDFSQKLSLEGKEGVLAEISEGLNKISESVNGSLTEIRNALGHMASGDMTYQMSGRFEGIFSDIADAVTEATSNMSQTLTRVAKSAETVSESSKQLSGATSELARRSEENAGMLKSNADSIEQMSNLVTGATKASQDVSQNVVHMSEQAASDSEIVGQTIAAMEEIKTSSEEIVKVLSVIDDIAFQTNLLALNAGVEAARAGESGRGFAVVATEVRALAQRSSEAGKEIALLVEASAENVQRGVQMVDQTANSLNDVVSNVKDISQQIEQITMSFEDTRKRIDNVSTSTATLDQSTRANVEMIEDAHQSVQLMDREAQSLNDEVRTFNVQKEAGDKELQSAA